MEGAARNGCYRPSHRAASKISRSSATPSAATSLSISRLYVVHRIRFGSGRYGGGPTVESTFRVDIDALRRHGLIRLGRGGCVIRFSGPYHDLDVEIETHIDGPWNDWVRLKYEMRDYRTGEPLKIDDKIFLATSRPPFGGLRWWFVCPRSNRRVRKLYLPLGGRHFWSRRAYELAYASQRETKYDRALRRARKLRRPGR
jgi:hypothetical protein